MAYLKGGSVVDGNLYIEGGLVVRNISTSTGGQLPTLDEGDAQSDYLVKFINNNGALKYSSIKEDITGDTISTDRSTFNFNVDSNSNALTIEKNTDNSIKFTLNTSSKDISVNETTPIYDSKGNQIDNISIDSILALSTGVPESFSYSAT